MSVSPLPPDGLRESGRALWVAILADLAAAPADDAAGWELDARELVLLEQAARQADLVADLERVLVEDGLVVAGSQGQSRLNAAATELRQSRVALAKLLGELALPGEDGRAMTAAQRRAQHAARTRYLHRGGRG